MKRKFLIQRKGFNYYTDYTELYLHKTLENKGFYLVKDNSKCIFSVIIYISDNEKYMTAISPYFDNLSEEETKEMVELLSYNFKSEVLAQFYNEECEISGSPYTIMFSDVFNAYQEEPFIKSGKPELVREIFSVSKNQSPHVIDYVNYGGAFKGLTINITFDDTDVEMKDATINYYVGKTKVSKEIFFEKTENGHVCKLNDFEMTEGINKYSAVLLGKKKDDEKQYHSFYLRFTPIMKGIESIMPRITVKAGGE